MSEPQSNDVPLPSPPFYSVDGMFNLRDVGGYAISPTTSVRRNYIYRSAHLSKTTPTGAKTISDELNITRIYDFRSDLETTKAPSVDIPGSTRLHTPVFKDQDASPEGLALRYKNYSSSEGPKAFGRAYAEILTVGAKSAYRTVFEHIRDRPTEPLLFHCTAGKDRTGVFAALVLRVAGVDDDEVICREYELTESALGGLGGLRQEFIERLLKHEALKDNLEGVKRMIGAKAESMRVTLEWLDSTYGGAEGYMKETMGFDDDDISKIKENLVVQEKAIL